MPNRYKLVATLLPIAAIGFLVAEELAKADFMQGPASVAGATTLDAEPHGRGARSDYAWLADAAISIAADATAKTGHPRRSNTRSLAQPENSLALATEKPQSTSPRGARG
jgi:hypothetical protein